jgi:ArsR family transcriptional regulator
MALPRSNEFPDKDLKLADFAKAIAHPARIAILRVLAEKKECICGELVADLPLAQSTVSQHLKALKEAGLVKGEIDGPRSCYCIDWKNFEKLCSLFGAFEDILKGLKGLKGLKVQNKC